MFDEFCMVVMDRQGNPRPTSPLSWMLSLRYPPLHEKASRLTIRAQPGGGPAEILGCRELEGRTREPS